MGNDYAVAVWIVSPDGSILLVRDLRRPPPLCWKCPGGRSEPGETPKRTAIREVQEETGLLIDSDSLQQLRREDRGTHFFYFFKAQITDLSGLKEISDEEEETQAFTLAKIESMNDDFLPSHRKIAETVGLLHIIAPLASRPISF